MQIIQCMCVPSFICTVTPRYNGPKSNGNPPIMDKNYGSFVTFSVTFFVGNRYCGVQLYVCSIRSHYAAFSARRWSLSFCFSFFPPFFLSFTFFFHLLICFALFSSFFCFLFLLISFLPFPLHFFSSFLLLFKASHQKADISSHDIRPDMKR